MTKRSQARLLVAQLQQRNDFIGQCYWMALEIVTKTHQLKKWIQKIL